MGSLKRPALFQMAGVVAAGSVLGTFLRGALEVTFPAPGGTWPWATFLINLSGSFLLGLLLEIVARAGDDTGWRRQVRLGVGTGIIGGFTTYSTFILEAIGLGQGGTLWLGAVYLLSSLVAGVICAFLGMSLGARLEADSGEKRC